MFEKFDDRASAGVEAAQREAHALGHDYIGTEHLLLGLLNDAAGVPTRLLASRGVDAGMVRDDIIDLIGINAESKSDATALLAAIGIDVDEIRRHAETTFGSDAVQRAALRTAKRRRWHRVRTSRVLSPFLGCHGPTPPCASPLTSGRWLKITPRSKHTMQLAVKDVERRHQAHVTPTHLLLGILVEGNGLACQILTGRGVQHDDLIAATQVSLDDQVED